MRRLLPGLILVLALAGCGDSGTDTSATPTTGAPAATTAPPDTTTPPETPETTAAPAETAPATTATAGAADPRELLDVATIPLGKVTTGARRPLLSWDPVDGAASYALVVLDGDGAPYWAWSGVDTSVWFGGGEENDDGQVALLHEPMTWRVAAHDAAGILVGISDEGALQP